jgi:predicted O-methyltransferase YrrM
MGLQESLRRFQLGRYGAISISSSRAKELLAELAADLLLQQELRAKWEAAPSEAKARIGATLWATGPLERRQVRGPFALTAAESYILARALAPEAIIETGVAAGVSSAFWLAALERNRKGRLWSIDLPSRTEAGRATESGRIDRVFTPESVQPGWLVPARLRARWELRLGSSQELLPRLLTEVHPDLFFHDSEHSYETMNFEYTAAWESMRQGGWIYSDDISWNRAFPDFVERQRAQAWILPTGRGLLLRPRQSSA